MNSKSELLQRCSVAVRNISFAKAKEKFYIYIYNICYIYKYKGVAEVVYGVKNNCNDCNAATHITVGGI